MAIEVGDMVSITNLDTVEEYNEEYDEYEEVDQPYVEDDMWDLMEEGHLLKVTAVNKWDGFIMAGGFWFHPEWLAIERKGYKVNLTGANETSKYKVIISKVLMMQQARKEKGHAY
jgi:hypothetical protein